jgi:transposase-like protein
MSRNENERVKVPDPEVVPLAQRRQFSAQEKLRILKDADACTKPGEVGALLRREGIYSSYLSRWRRARERGELTALEGQKRGPKGPSDAALKRELSKLRHENEQLQASLEQAETIIEVQKKLSTLLGLNPETTWSNGQR